jgi:hypothetical protein
MMAGSILGNRQTQASSIEQCRVHSRAEDLQVHFMRETGIVLSGVVF